MIDLYLVMEAYGAGVRDTIDELAMMPASDRDAVLAKARKDWDAKRFVLCPQARHWLLRDKSAKTCPYCND